jgi:serine/threonine protein kinase
LSTPCYLGSWPSESSFDSCETTQGSASRGWPPNWASATATSVSWRTTKSVRLKNSWLELRNISTTTATAFYSQQERYLPRFSRFFKIIPRTRWNSYASDLVAVDGRLRSDLVASGAARGHRGRFSGLRRCGVGNFSAVLSADEAGKPDRVAIKVCLPFQPPYRVESFQREAELLHLLRGEPDIIQIVAEKGTFTESVTFAGGTPYPWPFDYYALELAQGDLGDVIAGGGWDAERTLVAFRAMCRAVQRIHSRNIVHRDLKPSNFLVLASGSVKLSDFGAARRIDGMTPALLLDYSAPPGDLRYCAPEMLACLHGEDPTIAYGADIFSLGALLFEAFSGTILGLRLFNQQFWVDIAQAMLAVRAGHRQRTYNQIVGSISNSRHLPSVGSFGAPVPNCLLERVDDLYRSLVAIDYRRRLCDFDRIFNKINTCLLIIRNERKYQHWLQQKKRRRVNEQAKFLSGVGRD